MEGGAGEGEAGRERGVVTCKTVVGTRRAVVWWEALWY